MFLQKLALMIVAAGLLTGCGDGKLKTWPVTGKVTFADGEPLAGGTIQFQSKLPAAAGLNAQGAIGADGTFRLSTYVDGDGAIEGEHQVIVAPAPYWETATPNEGPSQPLLDAKYRSYETSGLTFTVKPGDNQCPITVERPK